MGCPTRRRRSPARRAACAEVPLTNALLTGTDRVQVLDAESLQGCSPVDYAVLDPGVCAIGEFPLFDRPPLVAELSVQAAGAAYPLTVIVNHWKSKAGDEAANQPRRLLQAQHVAGLVSAVACDAGAAVAVLGDLNDYYGSEVVGERWRRRLTPTWRISTTGCRRWPCDSYIFNGASQKCSTTYSSARRWRRTPARVEIRAC